MAASSNPVKRSRHEELAAEMRQQIRTGILKPGQKMPSLTKLNAERGIPQPTIIRAHDLLEREGLITRRRGSGTYVSEKLDAQSPEATAQGAPNFVSKSLVILTDFNADLNDHSQAPGWAVHMSLGMIQAAYQNGLHAVLLQPSKVSLSDIAHLIAARPYGLILGDPLFGAATVIHDLQSEIARAHLPIVTFGDSPTSLSLYADSVSSDHEMGAYMLAEWLFQQGRTKILCLLPQEGHLEWVSSRHAGYQKASEKYRFQPRTAYHPSPVSKTNRPEQDFRAMTRFYAGYLAEHLVGPNACDAVMVFTDGAVGPVAAACRLLGRVPNQDVFLVGYDNYWQDMPERQWEPSPPLATVDKRNNYLGASLVALLTERVEGRLTPQREVRTVPPLLVVTS